MNFPRVTEIIRSAVPESFEWFTEGAAERGKRIHEAVARYEAFGDRCNLEEWHAVRAWLSFRRATPTWRLVLGEHEVRSSQYGYTGHPDWLFEDDTGRIIVDVKTGAPADWHLWQVTAYTLCDSVAPARGVVLYLAKDEAKWRLSRFVGADDCAAFLRCLRVAQEESELCRAN